MKKKAIYRFLLLLVIAVGITYWLAPVFSFERKVATPKTPEEFAAFLNFEIPRLMKTYDIPGVVIGLISNGEPVWENAYGYADVEKNRVMTTDAYCRMESISKSVTAWGVMNLVEEGKIHLDTPVTRYYKTWEFPESPYNEEEITPRRLLSHTAGMPLGTIGVRYSPNEKKPFLRQLLTRDAILQEEPGKEFSYSNTGYILLELLIEEVTQKSFSAYMEEEILLPLGMNNSSFEWKPSFDPPVPNGYDAAGNPIPVYVYPDKAPGGLFSTMEDVMRFVTAGFPDDPKGNKILEQKYIQLLYRPQTEIGGLYGIAFEQYALGHFTDQLPRGKIAVSHGGQGTGWMTQFYAVPADGNALVIFANSQRSWPFFAAILNSWGSFEGYGKPGMGKLVSASKAIWILFGILLFFWLWKFAQVTEDLLFQKRHFSPLSAHAVFQRLSYLFLLVGLPGLYYYIYTTDYFEPASLFPVAIESMAGLGIFYLFLLVLLILFPVNPADE